MQFVDKALARRFEACEEMPQVFYARVFQKTRPEIGAAEEEICGGHMVFAGLGSPIGRATGAGLDRPFTAEAFDRLEEFYRAHNAPSQVDLCPLHDAGGIRDVQGARLRHRRVEQRALPEARSRRRVFPAYQGSRNSPQLAGRGGGGRRDRGACLLSRRSARAVSRTARRLCIRWKVHLLSLPVSMERWWPAALGWSFPSIASSRCAEPERSLEFRGRGLQTALLRARMAAAAQAGCEYAVVVTSGGTTSQRNCERLGFRVAYSKVTVIKNFVAPWGSPEI